jgi:hypothetical protein
MVLKRFNRPVANAEATLNKVRRWNVRVMRDDEGVSFYEIAKAKRGFPAAHARLYQRRPHSAARL